MSRPYIDQLMEYLEGSNAETYQGEQKRKLLKRIIFDGKPVDQVTYNYAVVLYKVATRKCAEGDMSNAKAFLYHCAKNMGVLK